MNPDKRYNSCDTAEEAAAKGDQSPAQQTPKPRRVVSVFVLRSDLLTLTITRKKKAASGSVPVETRAPDEKPIVPVKLPFDGESDDVNEEEPDGEDTNSGTLLRKPAGELLRVARLCVCVYVCLCECVFRAAHAMVTRLLQR